MATATLEKTAKTSKKNIDKTKHTTSKTTNRKAKKTATISMRVEPKLKKEAEEVCARAGLTVTNAIDMFLYQIVRTQGIPVDITNLPPCPDSMNADLMTRDDILHDINEGLKDIEEGRVYPLEEVVKDIPEVYNE